MGKTVAITGVNSYFASTILPRLQADPEVERIVGIDVAPWKGGYDKVDFHREDVRSTRIAGILRGADVVYHLAFVVGEIQDKDRTYDINLNGSRNVFKACVENGVGKVIYTSSMTVYGSHPNNPLGFTETSPLARNDDSYYNTSKVEVERLVEAFFQGHPEITLTILRVALLCGPRIDNMFSRLWSMKIGGLPMGRQAHNQLIHEEDLGEALYRVFQQDVPGVYNVTADDAVPTAWCFREAGVRVVPLPTALLRGVANLAFKLRLFPAGGGWASLGEYTIYGSSEKFKRATGWRPRYTSEQAFRDYLQARQRDARDNALQATLSWVFSSGARIRPTWNVLHIFKLGRIPWVRNRHPWMDPRKNSMSYLPISYGPAGTNGGARQVEVNQQLDPAPDQVLPPQIVHDFIDQADYHVVMDTCGCRLAGACKHFTHEVGCLFMGETASKLPHGVSRRVTPEQAHAHVDRAVSIGLVPMIGKVRVDNFIFLTPDKGKLLSVCFCCHCCCMMGSLKHLPAEHLDEVMVPLEGVSVEVTDDCMGCGTCLETCIFDAIRVENGKAVHNAQCRACGRCVTYCPQDAVKITIREPERFREEAERRIEAYVDIACKG